MGVDETANEFLRADDTYEKAIGHLVKMIDEPHKWLIKNSRRRL